MPRPSVWLIRSALVYLATGFTFGALMLSNKGLRVDPMLWRLLPAHIELPPLADGTPAHTLADGRRECLLISLYLPEGSSYNAYCPIARDAASGALRSAIAPLQAVS